MRNLLRPLFSPPPPTSSPSCFRGTPVGWKTPCLPSLSGLALPVAVNVTWPPRACPALRLDQETVAAAVHGVSPVLGTILGSADWLTLSDHGPVSWRSSEPHCKAQALTRPHPVCEQ